MNHDLTKPCPNCPFRNDIKGYLAAGRVREITASLAQGQSFPCHKTTVENPDPESDDDLIEDENSQQCAGAEIFLAHQGQSTQMARIAERLGMPVATLDMDQPVCRTVEEMMRIHGEQPDDEIEPCSVVDYDCLSPAGELIGGVVMPPDDAQPTEECYYCGEHCCDNCSGTHDDLRECNTCREYRTEHGD